jgi:YidC/Oxa1 family membrane protein insertase
MNFKEIVFAVCLAVVVTRGVEYFLFSPQKNVATDTRISGESFIVPQIRQHELNKEIDFIDVETVPHAIKTEVETDHAHLVFSTHGASLEQLDFKRVNHGAQGDIITTIFPVSAVEKEKRCFLVGFDGATPYYYTLSSRVDRDDRTVLTYSADFDGGRIEKTFTIFKLTYRIDMMIRLIPHKKSEHGLRPRIFFPAPIMPDIASYDVISGVMNDVDGSVVTAVRTALENKGWTAPAVFGAENRYFIHTMVHDPNQFAQRGYYSLTGVHGLSAIVEGPDVEAESAWTVSFYCGPKEHDAIMAVDSRLAQTLGTSGILAPISNWLLRLLIDLYRYFGSYGVAIIILTILMKIVLLPFSYKSAQGLQKNAEVNHKLKYLQQKYKDNPERLAQERLELIQREGMPGIAGCLPLLLQLPIFVALSRVLSTSVEFYRAPFALWSNLAAPDPYYILPALIVVMMMLQAMTAADPKQRTTMLIPAFIFGAFSISFSAGLCLYIAVSTFLGVVQTEIQKKWQAA